jgi:hypothetical protein
MATRHRPAASPPSTPSGTAARPPVTFSANERPGERGEDVGLPRLPEPFHRVYSPPEAPRVRTRRSGVIGAIVAVVAAVTLAAVGVFAFVRGGVRPAAQSPARTHASTHPHGTAQATQTQPAAPAAQPPVFATIPTACGVLPPETVRRFVPTASPKVDKMGAETASVCKYSLSQGSRYRAVQVDARAFLPKYMHDQATSMTIWSYEAQWKQAVKDLTPDTSSLRRIGGLGDAAFERYWIDRDVHVAVGEATVRYRNVVLRTQYSEQQPPAGDRAASEQRCLAAAIAAARAGLPAFH